MIVTGEAGYIRPHACKAFFNAAYTPITVDNLATGYSEAAKFGPLQQVDLLDQSVWKEELVRTSLAQVDPVAKTD